MNYMKHFLPVQNTLDKLLPYKPFVPHTTLISLCISHIYYAESSSSCFSPGEESKWVQKSHQALGWRSSQSPFHSSVMYRNAQRFKGTHWWTVFAQTHYWISAIFTWHFGPLLPVWHLRARTTCLWRDDYIMVRLPACLVYSWGATNIEGSN